MSDRSRAAKLDIDYKVYHRTGEKVLKSSSNSLEITEKVMEQPIDPGTLNEKTVSELLVAEDLKEFYLISALADLETKEELVEGLEQISNLSTKFRHMHVELKNLMGETDHAEKYPNYDEDCTKVREYIKNVRLKIKKLDQDEQKNLSDASEKEKTAEDEKLLKTKLSEVVKVRNSLQIEEEVFGKKIEREITNFDLDNPSCIQKSLDRLEMILDNYYKLFSNVKVAYGDSFETACPWKQNFVENIEKLDQQIKLGKARMLDLEKRARKLELEDKAEHEKQAHKLFVSEQKFNCETLERELELRCNALIKKCDLTVLSGMTDYQIFECNSKSHVVDSEMREIFDKFTNFSKVAATLPDEREALMAKPREKQKCALEARNKYAQKLHSLMSDRDISAEKLRNASTITVELAKFKGYDSKLDIYTFRTEFEKLIQPACQKHLLVDTLKTKYLEGPALTLVERLEDLSEIWAKLTGAYGNVKLLLQNKISKLDKLESLEKIKNDEKLTTALAKIINIMAELKSLAEKHSLETKLYVGGGLEKILNLIGRDWERKFLIKYVDSSDSSSSSDLTWYPRSTFIQLR